MSDDSDPPPSVIKDDPQAFPGVEYPSVPDARFLAETLGVSLSRGLAEVAMRRPVDPIEYLAHYLYSYRANCEYYAEQGELAQKVALEMEAYEREQAQQARLREEAKILKEKALERERQQKRAEIQLKEENERKLRDSLIRQRPELPTLQEDEEEEQVRARDEWGQTQLHLLAGKEGSELHALLQQGYNIADRDMNGKTPRDHAKDSEIKENVDLIDEYVMELFHHERTADILQLVTNGYMDQMPDLTAVTNISDSMRELIDSLPALQEKVTALFTAAASGNLEQVKETLDRKGLALAKNHQGQSPLHVAVLNNHKDTVEHFVTQHPQTVHCKDNVSQAIKLMPSSFQLCRQPLHYAYAVSEELVTLLLEHNADKDAEDVKKKVPSHYTGQLADIYGQPQPQETAQ